MTNTETTVESKNTDIAGGVIDRVTGPLVRAHGMSEAKLYEVVKVSEEKLMGEIIELHGDGTFTDYPGNLEEYEQWKSTQKKK